MLRLLPIEEVFEVEPDELVFMDEEEAIERVSDEFVDKVLLKSIENFGIQVPVIAVTNAYGKLTVVDGVRRVFAAKKLNIKVPVIVKNYSTDTAIVMRIALNLSQKTMSLTHVSKLAKNIKRVSMLQEIGLKTTDIYSIINIPKEVEEKLRWYPPEVKIEVGKVALLDKNKGKELITLVKREDVKTKEDVERLKREVNKMKVGITCGLCGRDLSKNEVNWFATCSSCKWILTEEFSQTIFEKKVKDWITGHYIDIDEAIVVSKKALFELIDKVPEDVRLDSGLEELYERLKHELGIGVESIGQGEQASSTVTV